MLGIVLSTGRIFAQEKDTAMPIVCFCQGDAQFPGGALAFERYIQDSIRYPQSRMDFALTGQCYTRFEVLPDGTINNIQIIQGISDCPECDKEIIRLLRNMPRWTPATKAGIPVTAYYTIPFTFGLK